METREFPISAGILFGLGLGSFFDGIILHQVLQWHHMLTSAGYPAAAVANLEFNTPWDGIFPLSPYVFLLLGLVILWKRAHQTHIRWSAKLLAGSMLMGFGIFNVVEGIVDHHVFGIHHVNETVAGPVDLLGSCLPRVGRGHAHRGLVPTENRRGTDIARAYEYTAI